MKHPDNIPKWYAIAGELESVERLDEPCQIGPTPVEFRLRQLLTNAWCEGFIELETGPDDLGDDELIEVGNLAISIRLDQSPEDWELRTLYADWLEEQGDAFCETQRWMVANENCAENDYPTWDWWSQKHIVLTSDLEESVFNQLDDGRDASPYRFREYPTRHAAEVDLHNALVKAGVIHCALIEEVEA